MPAKAEFGQGQGGGVAGREGLTRLRSERHAFKIDYPVEKTTWELLMLRAVQFLAILFSALALVPGGAHLLALANKIALAQDTYFVVQGIYRGWALVGIVLIAVLIFDLAAAVMMSDQVVPFRLALAGIVAVAATLAIFFTWTYPANVATGNWTTAPENWQHLRTQWEYSHAANAVIALVGLYCVVWSALLYRAPGPI